jgi:Arc/MetJ-type ribon-helix-helix transcriptional regulator
VSIDIAPETERVVREELRSGHFRSVDDLILSSVQAWRERETNSSARDLDQQIAASSNTDEQPIWETITEIMKNVPDEVFDRLPKDGAGQVDHYIYGLPKRELGCSYPSERRKQ